jgi:V/A-type H+/Na+-transporting ATPase subunit E
MSEPLEKLQNRILSDARQKADETIKEAEAKAEQILEEAKARAKREADETIAKTNIEAESIRRSILSSKVRVNRLKILDEKNRIVQHVISSVEERLLGIADTPEFAEIAKHFISEAVNAVDSEQPVINLGFKEASKKSLDSITNSFSKNSKVVFEDQPIEGLGGVIASDSEGRVKFNNSFKSRLERLDSKLLTLISATIFGE